MLPQAIMILGLLVNTTLVNEINDPMIRNDKVITPVVVKVNGGVRETSADKFIEQMYAAQKTGQPIIPIIISSYGGSVHALFKMVDVINKIKQETHVATIVIGKAMSAGAVLLSCGSDGLRFAAPNSTMMIHEVSTFTWGKTVEIKNVSSILDIKHYEPPPPSDAKETDRLNKTLLKMISVNIGKSRNYIADIVHSKGHADWYITPEQALEHGIVNKIGIPDLKIEAKVTVTLK